MVDTDFFNQNSNDSADDEVLEVIEVTRTELVSAEQASNLGGKVIRARRVGNVLLRERVVLLVGAPDGRFCSSVDGTPFDTIAGNSHRGILTSKEAWSQCVKCGINVNTQVDGVKFNEAVLCVECSKCEGWKSFFRAVLAPFIKFRE